MARNDTDWTDRMVGARMTVDDRYASTIEGSEFSRQEWGLIMTAVEFDIEHPTDDERARLIADTSHLPDVMPELERVRETQGAMGATGGPGGGGSGGSGGVLGAVKDALGLGSGSGMSPGGSDERLESAETLVDGYAAELQSYLEKEGRWHEVRVAYRER